MYGAGAAAVRRAEQATIQSALSPCKAAGNEPFGTESSRHAQSSRFAQVPLAVLILIAPFAFSSLVDPAGADTVADCEAAFSSPSSGELTYTTDTGIRLAYSGQTLSLSGGWDPAAWESLDLAVACIRLDDNTFDQALGTSQPIPANSGVFSHSFVIPQVAAGTRLCTRIGLIGDPVGELMLCGRPRRRHRQIA